MQPSFDPQPQLASSRLQLRPLRTEDREALYQAASSPETWAGHPSKDRHERAVFEPYVDFLLQSGGTLVAIDPATEKIIGCSRYYGSEDHPERICIGFTFLHHKYWGGATNFEMKQLMLEHAFRSVDEVWFDIAPSNIRSQKAIAKLGAEYMCYALQNLSGSEVEWMCFRLRKQVWEELVRTRSVTA